MPIIVAAGTMKRGDIDDAPNLRMPHVILTRAAARGDNGGPPAGAPDVDPQERIDSLFVHLGTGAAGLSGREAERRLVQFGANEITRTEEASRLRELVRQLAHPLALLLWVAAGLSLVSGNRTLALAIVAVILLNATLAYAQELQAERATEALKELLPAARAGAPGRQGGGDSGVGTRSGRRRAARRGRPPVAPTPA